MPFARYMLAALMTALAAIALHAQERSPHLPALLSDSLPAYVRLVNIDEEPEDIEIPDSVYYEISGKVVFLVNSTRLNLQSPFLKELEQEVLPLTNDKGLMLVGIEIRGAASPEGPYDNNVRLSIWRANALRQFISNRVDSVLLNDANINTTAEDYPRLLWTMERANDPEAHIVRQIIEECGIDNPRRIKERLRAIDGGAMWQRLLRQYFPELRAAQVVLLFKRINPKPYWPPMPDFDPSLEWLLLSPPVGLPEMTLQPSPPTFISERRHLLAVSSNLLYDAFYMPNFGWAPMPNIGIEFFPPAGRFTFKAQFMCPYYHRWSKHKFFQVRDYHLEARCYFNPGKLHTGPYAALYANATKYGIGLSAKKGWQGEGIGGALKLGYVIPLGSGRWRLDLHVAAGAWTSRYDPYVYGNPLTGEADGDYYYDWSGGSETFHRRNHRFTWFGPTEVGATLSFDILYRRNHKRGASCIRWEAEGL